MATVTSTALTLEGFSRLPGDGVRHEINAGELITLPFPKSLHSRLVRSVFIELHAFLQKEGTRQAYLEAGFLLSLDPLTVRQPDVSVLSKTRVEATPEDNYFEGAPELAVEVVSPSNSAEDLQIKIRQYLNTGAKQVWVLYPKTKEVQVFASGQIEVLGSDQVLEGRDLLPGFNIKVSSLFDAY